MVTPFGSWWLTRSIARLDAGDHLHGVAALYHLHNALDHVVLLVEHHHAGARSTSDYYFAQVTRHDRAALAGCDHHLRQILEIAEDANAANHHRLVTARQDSAARIGTVLSERVGDLVDGDLVFAQRERVDAQLVFLHAAAEAHDISHVGHPADRRTDYPVLNRAHLVAVHFRRRLDHIAEDLADSVGKRPQSRLHARR